MAPSRSAIAVALAAASLVVLGAAPASAVAPAGCEVSDATLTWGFKESFRAYIDGGIANGEWTTSGGAAYETPAFGWSGGTGRYDPATETGYIGFTGSVRFTGHGGVLDTTIANPMVRLEGDSGELLLDVAGTTMDGTPVEFDQVEFVALTGLGSSGEDALRTVEASTVLTAEGATAFPNYAAGEAFDPIVLSIAVSDACTITSGGGDAPESPAGPSPLVWLIAGAAFLVAVAAAVVAVLRRRSRA